MSRIRFIPKFIKRHIVNLRDVLTIVKEPSYYADEARKSEFVRLIDNIAWMHRFHEANTFYNLYGFDRIKSSKNGFIDYRSFKKQRDVINGVRKECSYIILLRDKRLFYNVLTLGGVLTPEVFALVIDGKYYDLHMNCIETEHFSKHKNYFIKDQTGECASFVKKIKDFNDLVNIMPQISKGNFVMQKQIYQHSTMNKLNPNAVNTLRIVTVMKNGEPEVLTSLLRVGTEKTGNVDNWAAGGLAIGIYESGKLHQYGFYKPHYGTKIDRHPDTGIVFSEFEVPYYHEALESSKKAHKLFHEIGAIGWDVVITPEGPAFIEANDNWEISLQQACDKPLKAEWLEAVRQLEIR